MAKVRMCQGVRRDARELFALWKDSPLAVFGFEVGVHSRMGKCRTKGTRYCGRQQSSAMRHGVQVPTHFEESRGPVSLTS